MVKPRQNPNSQNSIYDAVPTTTTTGTEKAKAKQNKKKKKEKKRKRRSVISYKDETRTGFQDEKQKHRVFVQPSATTLLSNSQKQVKSGWLGGCCTVVGGKRL